MRTVNRSDRKLPGQVSLALCGVLALALCAATSESRAQTYTITDLGTLGGPASYAYGINASGQVVGWADTHFTFEVCFLGACDTYFYHHAFIWTPDSPNGSVGTIRDLGGYRNHKSDSYAIGINNHGAVVGALLWENGRQVNPAPNSPFADINDSGQVIGPNLFAVSPFYSRPFIWQNGVYHELGVGGVPTAINAVGQVIVKSEDARGSTLAFLWTPKTANGTNGTLVPLGQWFPRDLNDRGQVVGSTWRSDGLEQYDALLWTPTTPNGTNGTITQLGPGVAYGINNAGQVVGTYRCVGPPPCPSYAFIWDSSQGRRNLDSLIPPDSGWFLRAAQAINDVGQIVGTGGHVEFGGHAFLLTPLLSSQLSRPSVQTNGQFRFTLVGNARRSYTIQASTNLVNWVAVTNFVSATGTNQFTDVTAANFNRRFYRAVSP